MFINLHVRSHDEDLSDADSKTTKTPSPSPTPTAKPTIGGTFATLSSSSSTSRTSTTFSPTPTIAIPISRVDEGSTNSVSTLSSIPSEESTNNTTSAGHTTLVAVASGAICTAVAVIICIGVMFLIRRRRRSKRQHQEKQKQLWDPRHKSLPPIPQEHVYPPAYPAGYGNPYTPSIQSGVTPNESNIGSQKKKGGWFGRSKKEFGDEEVDAGLVMAGAPMAIKGGEIMDTHEIQLVELETGRDAPQGMFMAELESGRCIPPQTVMAELATADQVRRQAVLAELPVEPRPAARGYYR
ncbi:hypothetical protein EX30DRAFT_341201 [Ascodesmis nigricans]|uniref:Uncharacterized protein n=1 Tax=Ascodesmis nigricans TaxID=341454 RepID=A0A4S2MW52_9PEZI|nr:hypothetical protein EX30DRAFT_341201 [Ascodesmis nigricans]